jgi:hypothetical protein
MPSWWLLSVELDQPNPNGLGGSEPPPLYQPSTTDGTTSPAELLLTFGDGDHELLHVAGYIMHAFGLTVFYSVLGIVILNNREFKG